MSSFPPSFIRPYENTSEVRDLTKVPLYRIGWENSLGGSPYSNQFRAHRKYMSRIIGSKNVAAQFNDLQVVEVGHFLLRVLENPDGLVEHIRK